MTSSQSPPTFAEFFLTEPDLKPTVPLRGIFSSLWYLRLRLAVVRRYWKTHKPEIYFQELCSIMSALLSRGAARILAGDTIVAPGICRKLTDEFRASAYAASTDALMGRPLNRLNQSYSATVWAGEVEPTPDIAAQILFMWTAVAATYASDPEVGVATDRNHQAVKTCLPAWTAYLECLLGLQLR